MITIAKSDFTGTIANYYREANISSIDLDLTKYLSIDDKIAGNTNNHPVIGNGDILRVEAGNQQGSHNKLYFGMFLEGSPLASLFKNKTGWYLSDFSQKAFTLSSYFGATNGKPNLIEFTPFSSFNRNNVKVKMIGNLIGSVNSPTQPILNYLNNPNNGFTCCVITRDGLPRYYVSNNNDNYYIYLNSETERNVVVEATTDFSPWCLYPGEICNSIIHCNTPLSNEEFEKAKKIFLSISNDSTIFCSSNLIESSRSENLSDTLKNKINTRLGSI